MAKNKDTEKEIDGAEMDLDSNHAEPRVYELGFHIDPELSQEEAKAAVQTLRDRIEAAGTIIAEGEIEKIPLAYTVSRMETGGRRDFNSAYFGWIAYEAAGEGHDAVVNAARDSRVVRFLDVRTTKEAAQHAAEMHEFYRRVPQTEEQSAEEEDAADTAEFDAALKEAGV